MKVIYDTDTQYLPILITVGIGARHLPPQTVRQHTDWVTFKASLETLHLGSSFATAADVNTLANQLVSKIRRVQFMATILLLISTSRRKDLPSHIKETTTKTQATQTLGLHLLSQT
ncbi:hypothetical protein EVAR_93127_1 [Eumeta japonica]|uniref:Uncharacterized protein n=1 Tax=Eumeta variegata TaxID=151549 RepID=A0A4C1TIA7_EUMVA|nr:hypothetical protein EVAR_93127_1 [Eumeta japonica]